MNHKRHDYTAQIVWDGNNGAGTAGYAAYGREFHVAIDGKPELAGSADPAFRGDRHKHNPEDWFLSALAACHMLFYLSLCARAGIRVLAYEDLATGSMVVDADGGGRFESVLLRPSVTIAAGDDAALAHALHDQAHALCFIANSCSVPIRREASIAHAAA